MEEDQIEIANHSSKHRARKRRGKRSYALVKVSRRDSTISPSYVRAYRRARRAPLMKIAATRDTIMHSRRVSVVSDRSERIDENWTLTFPPRDR